MTDFTTMPTNIGQWPNGSVATGDFRFVEITHLTVSQQDGLVTGTPIQIHMEWAINPKYQPNTVTAGGLMVVGTSTPVNPTKFFNWLSTSADWTVSSVYGPNKSGTLNMKVSFNINGSYAFFQVSVPMNAGQTSGGSAPSVATQLIIQALAPSAAGLGPVQLSAQVTDQNMMPLSGKQLNVFAIDPMGATHQLNTNAVTSNSSPPGLFQYIAQATIEGTWSWYWEDVGMTAVSNHTTTNVTAQLSSGSTSVGTTIPPTSTTGGGNTISQNMGGTLSPSIDQGTVPNGTILGALSTIGLPFGIAALRIISSPDEPEARPHSRVTSFIRATRRHIKKARARRANSRRNRRHDRNMRRAFNMLRR